MLPISTSLVKGHFNPLRSEVWAQFDNFVHNSLNRVKFEKKYEEGLLNPTGKTTFSQIFLKPLLHYEEISLRVRP